MSLNDFLPLIVAFYMSYGPVKILGRMQNQIRQGEASLDRIEELLHAEDQLEDPEEPESFGEVAGEVVFEGVSFAYANEPTLDRMDLRIVPGERVALVGQSGAGKTTFVALIPRFFDVREGTIRVEGHDVRRVTRRDLRDHIALVSQHPILFRGTVRENILMGRPDADEEAVVEAARNAFAHEFILELPGGYECELGDRGDGLSGGQRQRIAIARAFLKDAPILILDEATSALDTESEAQVDEALKRLSAGRTTIMIAHRFSSIRSATRILVFEKGENGGRITGDGTHEELMETHAHYRDLYVRQTSREGEGEPRQG
jgi:subfamily B ATP-binding cassette protein MsbA